MIVGVWRLTQPGIYAENPDGTRNYPFGQDAVGRVLMTADGYAANSFQRANRANCITGTGPQQCTPEDAVSAFKSAVSYQYRYRLEPDADNPYKGKIIWDVDFVMYPNWQGQSLPRRYEIERDGSKWVLNAPFPQNPQLGLKAHLERER